MSNNPYFQHHFADSEQQYEASKMGMWAFLVTEVLTFAGLFCDKKSPHAHF
jgi:cytochrome c oxidase subunit 3